MSVKLDPITKLHAEDCDCASCEAGFGPTPTARAIALRTIRQAEAAKARLQQQAELPYRLSRPMPHVPSPRPYTAEEKADLERLREEFRKKVNHG